MTESYDDTKFLRFFKTLFSDSYRLALFFATIIGFLVLFPLVLFYFIHTIDISIWINFWNAFSLICAFISGSGYLGKGLGLLRAIFSRNPEAIDETANGENIGALVGIALGLILCATSFFVYHELVPVHAVEGYLLYVVNYFSIYGGLSNRYGRAWIDRAMQKLTGTQKTPVNYSYGIRGGTILSLILVCGLLIFCHFGSVSVFGLSLVCIALIGQSISASGYMARNFDWLFGEQTHFFDLFTDAEKRNQTFNWENFKDRTHFEQIGTFFGTVAGIGIGITLAIVCVPLLLHALPLLLPHMIVIAVPVLLVKTLTVISAANTCMGVFNRIGHFLDIKVAKKNTEHDTIDLGSESEFESKNTPKLSRSSSVSDIRLCPDKCLDKKMRRNSSPELRRQTPGFNFDKAYNQFGQFNQKVKLPIKENNANQIFTQIETDPIKNTHKSNQPTKDLNLKGIPSKCQPTPRMMFAGC